jgi:hypothetical protein
LRPDILNAMEASFRMIRVIGEWKELELWIDGVLILVFACYQCDEWYIKLIELSAVENV